MQHGVAGIAQGRVDPVHARVDGNTGMQAGNHNACAPRTIKPAPCLLALMRGIGRKIGTGLAECPSQPSRCQCVSSLRPNAKFAPSYWASRAARAPCHASMFRRHSGGGQSINAGVTIPVIQAQLAAMVLVAERHRLFGCNTHAVGVVG